MLYHVNNNVILTVTLNNVEKTANITLIVVVTLSITISISGNLVILITQAIQALFAGSLINLGCSATAYYVITNEQTNQQTQGSVNLSFSLVNNSEYKLIHIALVVKYYMSQK